MWTGDMQSYTGGSPVCQISLSRLHNTFLYALQEGHLIHSNLPCTSNSNLDVLFYSELMS